MRETERDLNRIKRDVIKRREREGDYIKRKVYRERCQDYKESLCERVERERERESRT